MAISVYKKQTPLEEENKYYQFYSIGICQLVGLPYYKHTSKQGNKISKPCLPLYVFCYLKLRVDIVIRNDH